MTYQVLGLAGVGTRWSRVIPRKPVCLVGMVVVVAEQAAMRRLCNCQAGRIYVLPLTRRVYIAMQLPSISVNKNADSLEREKWSFVLSSMDGQSGDLYTSVAGIHLPVCTRQQQAAASSSNICCKIRFISTVCFIRRLATNSLF